MNFRNVYEIKTRWISSERDQDRAADPAESRVQKVDVEMPLHWD